MAGDAAADRFAEDIGPLLRANDLPAVAQRVYERWSPDQLVEFVRAPSCGTVRAAIVCLGLTGSMCHCGVLAALLHDTDAVVVQLAEDSLWNIWMRGGSEHGCNQLAGAVDRINHDDFVTAVRLLSALSAFEPTFAEAHHQRGIALFFLDRFEDSSAAYAQAVRLNENHFSAAAGLGHVCAQRGDAVGALRYYRLALGIHPRLEGIPEAVEEIETALGNRRAAQ